MVMLKTAVGRIDMNQIVEMSYRLQVCLLLQSSSDDVSDIFSVVSSL